MKTADTEMFLSPLQRISIETFFNNPTENIMRSDHNSEMELLRTALYRLGWNPKGYTKTSTVFSNTGKFYDSLADLSLDGIQPKRIFSLQEVGFNTYNGTKHNYQTV